MLKITKPLAGFDLETTAKELSSARVVQIGIVKHLPNGEVIEWESLVNPGIPIPQEVVDIHGIDDEKVKDAPRFADIAQEVFEFIQDSDVAGYNSDRFDVPLLSEEFAKCGIVWPLPDTVRLDAYKNEQRVNSHKLGATYKRYTGEELSDAHSALPDVRATMKVLFAQTDNEPEMTPAELAKLLEGDKPSFDLAGKLYVNTNGDVCWTFGKHINQPVKDTASYAVWVLGSDFPSETKARVREIVFPPKNEVEND